MDTREIYTRLDRVFQDVFDDDSIHVSANTTANDIEDWDSLEHLTLISAACRGKPSAGGSFYSHL